jgi:hypothetical protein
LTESFMKANRFKSAAILDHLCHLVHEPETVHILSKLSWSIEEYGWETLKTKKYTGTAFIFLQQRLAIRNHGAVIEYDYAAIRKCNEELNISLKYHPYFVMKCLLEGNKPEDME